MKMLAVLIFCISTLVYAGPVAVPVAAAGSISQSGAIALTEVSRVSRYGVMVHVTDQTPSLSGAFSCATTDICTKAAHNFTTGLKVQVSTSSSLPTGLSTSTDYFVIPVNSGSFELASSLANANLGTQIDITGTGVGTQTITPTALASANLKLQGSMDGTNFVDLPIKSSGEATKSQTYSADGYYYLSEDNLDVNYVRVMYGMTAGQLSVSELVKVNFIK